MAKDYSPVTPVPAPQGGNSFPPLDWDELEVSLDFSALGLNTLPSGTNLSFDWFRKKFSGEYGLWFLTAGEGILEEPDGKKYPAYPGTALLFRPGDVYGYQAGFHEVKWYFFHFGLKHRKSGRPVAAAEIGSLPFRGEMIEVGFLESCCRRIEKLQQNGWQAENGFDREARLQANLLLRAMLMEYELSCRLPRSRPEAETGSHHARIVSQALSQIQDIPHKFEDVAGLARQYGYRPEHFSRMFKSVTGQPLKKVIIAAKIERAKRLLVSSTAKLDSIAQEVGYSEVFYFHRQFKQLTGRTPTQFRLEMREKAAAVLSDAPAAKALPPIRK